MRSRLNQQVAGAVFLFVALGSLAFRLWHQVDELADPRFTDDAGAASMVAVHVALYGAGLWLAARKRRLGFRLIALASAVSLGQALVFHPIGGSAGQGAWANSAIAGVLAALTLVLSVAAIRHGTRWGSYR